MSELAQQPVGITDDLLRTKLVPPHLDAALVSRPDVCSRIDTGLTRKLTLIATPAGFGKTTLVAEWVATRHHPVAWVTLDAGDNDAVRFWRYLLSACRTWNPAVGKAALAALRTAQQPLFETLLTSWINELAQLGSRHVLVVEDYHTITAPEIHATVTFLIEHLPDTVHLILTTRTEPTLPLARLRARNELTELTAEELRFSRAEIATFFQQTLHVVLPPEALTHLEQRTVGWVTGLRLLALALQHPTEPSAIEQFLTTFTGGHRHVIAYLVSEVLATQPEPLQAFLLRTSILTRLTGPLCDAITGRDDSAFVLEHLDQTHMFLTLLNSSTGHQWYRYHALFAEAMQHYASQRLGAAVIRELHVQASTWYEEQGLLDDAVEEAIAAEQPVRAAALIERIFERERFNELHTLRRWIERLSAFSPSVMRNYPLLCFAYANVLLYTSDRYAPTTALAVERWAQLAEASWREEGNRPRLGQIAALRASVAFWQGDAPRVFAQAREALELLDEHDVRYRSVTLLYVGQEQLLAGKIDAAQRFMMEAYTLFEVDQNIHGTLAATMMLGDLCYQGGDLEQATQNYEQVLVKAIGGEEMLDDQSYVLYGLSAIAYERDDLETAEQQAMRAIELAKQRHNEATEVQATLVQSRVLHARGQPAHAWHDLQSLATRLRNPARLRNVQCSQVQLALAIGDLEFAQRWQAALTMEDEPVLHRQYEQEQLVIARLHLVEGRPQAALDLLDSWRVDAATQGRTRSEIEILVLQALAHAALAAQTRAEQALTRALTLAQPCGLRRIFLDEGESFARLLQAVAPTLTKRSLAAYAATLLHAFTPSPMFAPNTALPLLEPLSPQEQRVLRLIVARRPNAEIARELVVSANTVKTHIKNIYRKLNVSTREEAQAAARELNLR